VVRRWLAISLFKSIEVKERDKERIERPTQLCVREQNKKRTGLASDWEIGWLGPSSALSSLSLSK